MLRFRPMTSVMYHTVISGSCLRNRGYISNRDVFHFAVKFACVIDLLCSDQFYVFRIPLVDCASYRPISLLNNDVKILAKVLARRLEDVLPSVISPDQTGFIKNRQSFFNICRLFNILYSPSESVPECIISMDAEKAFDRVEWDYLFTVLEKFGFGPVFISWIRLLYSAPSASVLTNSQYSTPFSLHRGTRQGCPISPLLFALAIEPLAIALRDSNQITGVVIFICR